MELTKNLGLKKPAKNEYAKIETLNENADKIDEKFKELEENMENLDTTWDGIKNKPETFPPEEHNHGNITMESLEQSLQEGKFRQITPINESNPPTSYPKNSMTYFNTSSTGYGFGEYRGIFTMVGTGYGSGGIIQYAIAYGDKPLNFRISKANGDGWESWQTVATQSDLNNISVIKSVQRGIIKLGGTSLSITISAVNASKCTVNLEGTSSMRVWNEGAFAILPYVSSLTNTSLTLQVDNYYSFNGYVSWEIVEFK